MRFMDRPPVCPQLRTLGLSPPSGVCASLFHISWVKLEWNRWVMWHFYVYLLEEQPDPS